MEYTVHTGSMYQESSSVPIARMKSSMLGQNKKIYLQDDVVVLQADIEIVDDINIQNGSIHNRRYVLTNQDDQRIAEAKPEYAEGEDPDENGWSIYRLPKVNRAYLVVKSKSFTLIMHNDQNYSIQDEKGNCILKVAHKGVIGGWTIQDDFGFTPEVLFGLFIFCRYLEKENEFLVV